MLSDLSIRSSPLVLSIEASLHPRQPVYGIEGFIFRPEVAIGYQLAPQLDSKTSRKRRGWVWQYSTLIEDAKQQQF